MRPFVALLAAVAGCGRHEPVQDSSPRTDTSGTVATTDPATTPYPVDDDFQASYASDGDDPKGTGARPRVLTAFLIVMENRHWDEIKDSPDAPYLNSLLPQAAWCDHYTNPFGTHPSEADYIWLEAGDNLGLTTNDDPSATNSLDTRDHLVTQLDAAGVSWRAYEEGISGADCPIVSSGNYAAKHNPMVFFQDVSGAPPSADNAYCRAHERPYTELADDLAKSEVARYNFITPDLCDDMHSPCGGSDIAHGDAWLSTEVPRILASDVYKNNGVIFITWDESEKAEVPIGMIVLSRLARPGVFHDEYTHSSTLRSMEEIFGVPLLRDANAAEDLSALFAMPLQPG